MNIVFDARSVFQGMGGIGRYSALLAHMLPTIDPHNRYHLLAVQGSQELATMPSNAQWRPHACGMIDERWEQLELPGILADAGADLYHGTCFSLPVAGGARRNVVTVHDVIFKQMPDLVGEPLRRYLDRWTAVALEMADLVITVSEFSKQEIVAAYGADATRIRVVANGVDPRFLRPGGRRDQAPGRLRMNLPAGYALYVGSMEEKKNIHRLLRAWKRLVDDGRARRRKLVLVGGRGGKQLDLTQAIAQARADDSVVAAGYLSDEDLVTVMCGADVFVYPSLYEGFGLPVLEAMACGVPVVTSRTTSLGEIAGDAAICVDPTSDAAVADGLGRVLGEPGLAAHLAERGLARVRGFTQERCARETLAVYHEVLAS